jgi:GAF domain-containing protein
MTSELTLAQALAEAAREINTRRPLEDVLSNLVNMAQRSLPGVDHVGISVVHTDGHIDTIAATDDLVLKFDQIQYELNDGPCLAAIRDEQIVVINHAEREQRWPLFTEQAVGLGLRSQMGLRLYADDKTFGGMNLYATSTEQIDVEVIQIASLFASHAALALGKAQIEDNLLHGMQTRQRIGVAVGVLMQQYDLDEERAFQYLARVSQNSNTKLRDVADEIVLSENTRNAIPLDDRPAST